MCFVCDKKGHFSRVCEQKKAFSKVLNLSVDYAASENEEDSEEMFYVDVISEDKVRRAVRDCAACALHAPRARRQPLLQHDVPALPWRKLASDIFEYRKKRYIILVDYFSNYVEVGELSSMSAKEVIKFVKDQFARHGIPSELVTDNGPAYNSLEFKTFLREWEVNHVTSPPIYLQSNGKSERTVQTVKNVLKKCVDSGQDFAMGLLNYRATPRNGLDSPAQILMGRRLNTKLPVNSKLLTERVDNERNYQALLANREEVKCHYDKSARSLARLSPGDKATLICKGTRKPVSVVARTPEPRSDVVEEESGGRYRRTRSHLVSRSTSACLSGQAQSHTTATAGSASKTNTVWMTGVRRRRKCQQHMVNLQSQEVSKKSTPQSAPAEERPEAKECDDGHLFESFSDESTSSSPAVPIMRSRERTARMLSFLLGSNRHE